LLSTKHVDFRTDLWSLAVAVYHALTGDVPFKGETVGMLSVAVHAGVFPPPSRLRPGLPSAVDAWVQRALQKDPQQRFGSARELADTLEMALLGRDATRAPMSSAHDGTRPPGTGSMEIVAPSTGPGPTLGGATLTHAQGGAAGRVRILIGLAT